VVLTVSICVLVFGPFSGQEARVGLSDKEAHAFAFYSLNALSLAALPRLRKWDVALVILAFGGLIEVVQSFVGRNGAIEDWAADGFGVALCLAPMMVQSLRAFMREDGLPRLPRRRQGDQTVAAPAGLTGRI